MQLLNCEKYRQMAKGSVEDRIAVASENLPYGCSSELYLQLSKDEHPDVRRALAMNPRLGDRCMSSDVCRVLGRLHKDKDSSVRSATQQNPLFTSNCDGGQEMDYTVEPWYGFDVLRADVHCQKTPCHFNRLIGELEAQNVDVVSIQDWRDNICHPDSGSLRDLGFHYIPSKLSWQLDITDTYEEYLNRIPKGNYIERRRKRLRKDNIVFLVMPVEITNPLEDFGYPIYYKQWYEIYKNAMKGKKRGRLIIKEDSPPTHLMAVYAVKDDRPTHNPFHEPNKVLGGILFNASKPGSLSGAYGAFLREPAGLSDVAMAEMVAYAYSRNREIHSVNLGMDTNFYGFHLGTGLYSYKTSLGYSPRPFRTKREYFKVLNDSKFDNPYMFLDFRENTEHSPNAPLRNNIFVKDDKKIYLDSFNAPSGILLHHKDKDYRYHTQAKKGVFFQEGSFASDFPNADDLRIGGDLPADKR